MQRSPAGDRLFLTETRFWLENGPDPKAGALNSRYCHLGGLLWAGTAQENGMSRLRFCFLGCAAFWVFADAQGHAPSPFVDNFLDDRFEVGADLIASSSTTHLRADSSLGILGTPLSAENDLGLPSRKLLGSLEVLLRPASRHTVRINYLFLPFDRSGSTVLTQDVDFKGSHYAKGSVVTSEFAVQMEGAEYTYSLLHSDKHELGIGFGGELVELYAIASGPNHFQQQRAQTSAPVPFASLEGAYRFSSDWYVQGEWQYLRGALRHVEGNASLWHAAVFYRLNPSVTFDVGFKSFNVSVDSRRSGQTGNFNLHTAGPMLGARVGF